jgi:hypothetical protein
MIDLSFFLGKKAEEIQFRKKEHRGENDHHSNVARGS